MTHWIDQDDDREDDGDDGDDALSDVEQPDAADTAGPDDDGDAVPCPFCKRAVHEEADVCPGCGNFIGGADDPSPRRPWWVTVGVLLCLAAMLVTCAMKMW